MRKSVVLMVALVGVFGWSSGAGATPYSTTVLSDSPVAYWRMGETSGPIVDEVSGRQGTLSGGNTTGVAGAIVGDPDTAISSGPSGGTISVPYDIAMNTPVFSLELWTRFSSNCTDGTGSGNHCNAAGPRGPSTTAGYALGPVDTFPAMTHNIFFNSSSANSHLQGPDVVMNVWEHLVASFDGSTASFYVNGALVDSQITTYSPDQSQPFELFGSLNKVMENGSLDEVAYYNYALGANRVENHYLTGIGVVPEPNTALLLGFGLLGLGVKRRRPREASHSGDGRVSS